jgi:hypothetical protein
VTKLKRVTGLIFIVIIAFALFGLFVSRRRHSLEISNELKRQDAYQAALRSFTRALKPGMKRREVEDYFRLNRIEFVQGALEDLSKISEEPGSWYCGPPAVYVRFEFTNFKKGEGQFRANAEDPLTAIDIQQQADRCL